MGHCTLPLRTVHFAFKMQAPTTGLNVPFNCIAIDKAHFVLQTILATSSFMQCPLSSPVKHPYEGPLSIEHPRHASIRSLLRPFWRARLTIADQAGQRQGNFISQPAKQWHGAHYKKDFGIKGRKPTRCWDLGHVHHRREKTIQPNALCSSEGRRAQILG